MAYSLSNIYTKKLLESDNYCYLSLVVGWYTFLKTYCRVTDMTDLVSDLFAIMKFFIVVVKFVNLLRH